MIDTIYHVGHLAFDRDIREPPEPGHTVGLRTKEADELHERALRMLQSSDMGKVFLYQKRCLHGFEYHCRMIRGA